MDDVTLLFNRTAMRFGRCIEQPSQELVANTLALWNVSPEDAMKYGGDLTRAALGACELRNDRRYVVVDTKVHMLKPGMWPAIPGWHTDGAPRGGGFSPAAAGPPDIVLQSGAAVLGARAPRYHLLVTGVGCLTEFLYARDVPIPVSKVPSGRLYERVTKHVQAAQYATYAVPSCQVVEWDWWELHRGVAASASEWRFLIRVTETDHLAPQTDARRFIRTQQQVYVPSEAFGW